MAKYEAPATAPAAPREFQLWLLDELRHIADVMSEIETDSVFLKQWNEEPERRYDGQVIYADGTNFNPGSGEGFYGYHNAIWHFLG